MAFLNMIILGIMSSVCCDLIDNNNRKKHLEPAVILQFPIVKIKKNVNLVINVTKNVNFVIIVLLN